jgi:hypothetical protein
MNKLVFDEYLRLIKPISDIIKELEINLNISRIFDVNGKLIAYKVVIDEIEMNYSIEYIDRLIKQTTRNINAFPIEKVRIARVKRLALREYLFNELINK